MKTNRPFEVLFLIAIIIVSAGFACNKAEPAANSSSAPASAPSTSTSAAMADLAGSYTATGTNESGGGPYSANLLVTRRGEVYQFTWASAGKNYDGVGIQTDKHVAVAFTEGTDGKGCGVVLYKMLPDGTLDGKAGYWGTNTSETEVATRTKGTDLDGEYTLAGTNAGGQKYTGTLAVAQEGAGYKFNWKVPGPIEGFGIRQGNMVSAGLGGKQCAFVSYEVKPDGTLNGKWGGSNSRAFGTEVAVRK